MAEDPKRRLAWPSYGRGRAERSGQEVKVLVEVADATGPAELPSEPIACGIAYLDHMLDQLNSHGQLRVSVQDGLLEKNHVDAAPLFEWVNSECPILQGELFDWDDQRRQTRRSYYDLRLDPKQGGAGEPNRALHDFKACELKSFVRKVHRSPGILEDLVRKKRDATWGEEKPTATGTRGFSRKLGTLIHRSFDS
ncbi:unnamed protein product [Durusdinium trenchii]|uniref:Decapping nuclease n=1 Tax=Durusdinium trenchii TaxID=1381693 RepID=A0ABP0RRV3_9DINO